MASGDLRSGQENDEYETVTSIDWTPENEVHLFYAMKNRKPVGIDRNFQMILINECFNKRIRKEVPSRVLWEHLEAMYDLDALNENNSPASSIVDEQDFALSSDFDEIIKDRFPTELPEGDEAPAATTTTTTNKTPAKATPKVESTTKTTKTRTTSETESVSSKTRIKTEESKVDETEEPASTTNTTSTTSTSTPKSNVKRRVSAKTNPETPATKGTVSTKKRR